jgi:YD repeat-containing protein
VIQLNRMTGLVDAGGFATAYFHDAKGNLTRRKYPNGTFTKNTYNAQGLILSSKPERPFQAMTSTTTSPRSAPPTARKPRLPTTQSTAGRGSTDHRL